MSKEMHHHHSTGGSGRLPGPGSRAGGAVPGPPQPAAPATLPGGAIRPRRSGQLSAPTAPQACDPCNSLPTGGVIRRRPRGGSRGGCRRRCRQPAATSQQQPAAASGQQPAADSSQQLPAADSSSQQPDSRGLRSLKLLAKTTPNDSRGLRSLKLFARTIPEGYDP